MVRRYAKALCWCSGCATSSCRWCPLTLSLASSVLLASWSSQLQVSQRSFLETRAAIRVGRRGRRRRGAAGRRSGGLVAHARRSCTPASNDGAAAATAALAGRARAAETAASSQAGAAAAGAAVAGGGGAEAGCRTDTQRSVASKAALEEEALIAEDAPSRLQS